MKIIEIPRGISNSDIDARELCFSGMDEVENILEQVLMGAEGIIKGMCLSLLNSGGKRFRPALVIMSGRCFRELNADIINTAVAAELIHMASLVHDDIIDMAQKRRGRPTINYTHGNHGAVLAGDYIFAKAFDILSSFKLLESMEYLVEAIQDMCDGEVNQAAQNFNTLLTVDDYFNRIRKKTASLVSSCCMAGAAAAGASEMEVSIMHEYGINVGYAFQIIDDILDFTGDQKKIGKPKGMDLRDGNITLPVILLMKDEIYGSQIKELLETRQITAKRFEYIVHMLNKSGAFDKSYEIARNCIEKAKASVYSIQDSPARSALLYNADGVINRDH